MQYLNFVSEKIFSQQYQFTDTVFAEIFTIIIKLPQQQKK